MKHHPIAPVLSTILILAFLITACSIAASEPTPIPPTDTPAATATKTPKPTSTPRPTATLVPTPAPLGSAVTYNSLEITVLDVFNRESVHFGDVSGHWETFYKPIAEHYLIDVGVLVHNLKPGNVVPVKWGNIFIVEENGDGWYPGWGKAKTVETGTKIDPFSIGLSSTNLNPDDLVQFDNDTYLRLIFMVVADPEQTILFGIEDSPAIGFKVNK